MTAEFRPEMGLELTRIMNIALITIIGEMS